MADSAIAITAGTGTSVDTRTEGTNGNHRQVVVLGDPDTNAGVAPVDATLGLGADIKGIGGAAVTAGAGAVSSGTLRMTLASDDPAVALLTTMDVDTGAMATLLGTIDTDTGAIATSVAVMDDWDETDRCKVNIVAGQAGITAGAGAVGASTPRVTLASDDPGVALLTTIDADTGSMATLLGTIDADTGSIATSASTIAGAVSGSEMQVDIVSGTVTANLSATDNAVLDAIDANTDNLVDAIAGEYETVAASQTGQALGATGGTGDFLSHLLVIPATTSPGNVIILDSATSITVFTGGASSVTNLVPFVIPLNMYSASGAWSVTTGANVSVIAVGNFT